MFSDPSRRRLDETGGVRQDFSARCRRSEGSNARARVAAAVAARGLEVVRNTGARVGGAAEGPRNVRVVTCAAHLAVRRREVRGRWRAGGHGDKRAGVMSHRRAEAPCRGRGRWRARGCQRTRRQEGGGDVASSRGGAVRGA